MRGLWAANPNSNPPVLLACTTLPLQLLTPIPPFLQDRIFPPGCPKEPLGTSIPILAPYPLAPNPMDAISIPSSTGVLSTPGPGVTTLWRVVVCVFAELHQTEGEEKGNKKRESTS